MGFGVRQGLQSIDASCGIQIDGFSARTEPPGSMFEDVHELDIFVCVFGVLMRAVQKALLQKGPIQKGLI